MGHEASGTIHSTGPSVTTVKKGDHVAIEPGVPCHRCKACKDGSYNLCSKIKFAAAPPDCDGMLVKYYVVPEDFVHRVGREGKEGGVSLQEAVLVEPLAVAVHAIRLMDVRPGETVAVFGSGTVGLLCAAVAKIFGAHRVVLVDVLERKLEFARQYFDGKCETFVPDITADAETNSVRLLEQLGLVDDEHTGVDTVIEASGATLSVQTGLLIAKPGGKYVQTGLGKSDIEIPLVKLSQKELMVRGCFRYSSGDFSLAAELLRKGLVEVTSLISSVSPFENVIQAWEKTARGEGIKNLIEGVMD